MGLSSVWCPSIDLNNDSCPVSATYGIPTVAFKVGSYNYKSIRLLDGGVPYDASDVSKMELLLDDQVNISSSTYPGRFLWYDTGIVLLKLGTISIFENKSYLAELTVFDPTTPSGMFWGTIRLVMTNYT